MAFFVWLVIMVPAENAEVKEIKKVNVLDSKVTTKKPTSTQKKETLADKMYKKLKPQEYKISLGEAITIIQNNNTEYLKQIEQAKHDKLWKSYIRWSKIFVLKDKSKIKIYWKKDKKVVTLFTNVEVVSSEVKKEKQTNAKKVTAKKSKSTRIKDIALILEVMKKNYKGVAKIEYDKNFKTIKIIPIDENFMLEALQAKDGKKEYVESWNIIVDELVKSSKSIDKSYSLTMQNTINTDNVLLMVQDGLVLYNYIN